MKQSTVAKLPGMYQRGTIWQLRVMIPLDLKQAYEGRTKLIRSLETSDWREAKLKGAKARAELLQEFDERRRSLNPEPVASITPELGETLGLRIRSRLLDWDDKVRGDPKVADLWLRFTDAFSFRTLSKLRLGPPATPTLPSAAELAELASRSPFDGLTPTQLSRLAEVNATADEAAALHLASRSLSAVATLADSEARKLGLLIDWKSPEARPVLLDCLRAYRAAHADILRRDEGQDVVTPQAPAQVSQKAATSLREVFTRWKKTKMRSEDSVRACERALALYEQRTNDTPVQALSRAQGDDFRSWLQTLGTSSKTAHDRLTWVKSLLVYAKRDLELIQRQPWEGIDIEHRTEKPRKPWTSQEQAAFFSLPLFSRYELPSTAKAGGAAAYWVPLLGLYTGARVGELCQLRVDDVEDTKFGTFIRIAEEAEGATVKTAAGIRRVPVHSELLRLGFLDYVRTLKVARRAELWSDMPKRKGKPGAYFSDWVNAFHKASTGNPKAPVFHELRHTVRTALHSAKVDRETIGRIIGHETGLSDAEKAYTHVSDMDLRAPSLACAGRHALPLQAFEPLFFKLVEDREPPQYLVPEFLKAGTPLAEKRFSECVADLRAHLITIASAAVQGKADTRVSWDLFEETYETFYASNESLLGPYFRQLFHIFKLIARSDLQWEEKVQYANIARASLDTNELMLLLLNCGSKRGADFKTYVEGFGLLKHIRTVASPGAVTIDVAITRAVYQPTATMDRAAREKHWRIRANPRPNWAVDGRRKS